MQYVKMIEKAPGYYAPMTQSDVTTLASFGFYDMPLADERTIADWKLERSRLGLDKLIAFLVRV